MPTNRSDLQQAFPAGLRESPDASPIFPPTSPSRDFPYRIEGKVGKGAMGIVYRATEVPLDRPVAVKVLRREALEHEDEATRLETRQRFLQEARAAAALSHPGVTTLYRVGEEAGLPYLVMEWLEGQNLQQVIDVSGPMPAQRAIPLILDLLAALEHAHAEGVVHRDIKPANLMLLADGRLKVTDFGIARLNGRSLLRTQAGKVMATPRFASPEQLQGLEADGRADLFSVGVLLFNLLTGTYPFPGKSFTELAGAILYRDPIHPRELLPEMPGQLEGFILAALEKDREKRFQSADDMARRLRALSIPEISSGASQPSPTPEAAPLVQGSPSLLDLPKNPALAISAAVRSWPQQALQPQPTPQLVERLLEQPLHAPPFSGALTLDSTCLFFCEGKLLGAVDMASGASGDEVYEALPANATPRLHPVPEGLPPRTVSLLTTLLRPPKVRHADLDASFINLPAMAEKLRRESFDGLFRLQRGDATGWVLFDRGEGILSLFSKGWGDIDVKRSWQHWIADAQVIASVEERNATPLDAWYRHASKELELEIVRAQGAVEDSGSRSLFSPRGSGTRIVSTGPTIIRSAGPSAVEGAYENDPAFRFLDWSLNELPTYMAERERTNRWKYLSEWLSEVHRAFLHHELPRVGSRQSDAFDVVTQNQNGKVLHLAERVSQADGDVFVNFLERVKTAKQARRKSGDVGGAFLVARHFQESALAAYATALEEKVSKSWFGVEESFTGYEGFMRVGPRRGFHLLLVEEREDGFHPLLPT